MYVHWFLSKSKAQSALAERFHNAHAPLWCVVVENVRVNGERRKRHIACLASINSASIAKGRALFWESVRWKLDQLQDRIGPADRKKIERMIARRIARR